MNRNKIILLLHILMLIPIYAYSFSVENIKGYWKFDENQGSIVNDESGFENHGTVHGAEWMNGQVGSALRFDGVNDYVEVPHDNSFNADVFTTAMWLYHDNGLRTCAYMRRVGGWHIRTAGGQWDMDFESGEVVKSGYYFPDKEWHHYAMTVDNINGTVTFYVDGEQFGDVHTYSRRFNSSSGALYIGQYSPNYRWKGGIDEVEFHQGALSPAQIKESYLSGKKFVGKWKFDENQGNVANDESGFENHGTIHGAEWMKGQVGSALLFDGENDYVEVPYDNRFNADVFTTSMWLYHDNGRRTCAYMRRVGGWHIRTSGGEWDMDFESGEIVKSGYYFPDKEWHHYAMTVDNINGTVTFYVDGEQYGDVHTYTRRFNPSSGALYIGQFSPNYRLKGGIDEVEFHQGALSPEQIKESYLRGKKFVGKWKFDENQGSVANDESGFENHGTIHGAEWMNGQVGSALRFDGENDYVEVPHNNNFNADVFTTSMWLYHDNGRRTCAYMRRVGGWHIRTSGGQWDMDFESGEVVKSGYYFPDKEWHHYAMTVDNINGTVTFYVDGEQFGDVHTYTNRFNPSSGALYIGQFSQNYRWKGGIDEVEFHQGALSSEQINESYLSSKKFVGKWKFDENQGSVASDESGFENHGTIHGAQWMKGQVGSALLFDGENDYVEVPHNNNFNADVFTTAMWLYHDNGQRTCAYMRRVGGWHIRTSGGQWDMDFESGEVVKSGYYFPDKEWHHYAMTVDNINGTVTFYVDGEQFGDVHNYTRLFNPSSVATLYIGQYSPNYRWRGGIDEVEFHQGGLSPEEIRESYLNSKTLVGNWRLDENQGSVANDESGFEKHGTIHGAEWMNGQVGSALQFDGVNDYVEVPYDNRFNADLFTTAMWLYHDNGQRTCAYMRRVGGWHIRTSGGQWDMDFEGGDVVKSGYYFPDKEWHHYAMTVDNLNGTVTFYVDGRQFGDVHTYTRRFNPSSGALYIGQFSPNYRWKGGIDEVKIYNRVLTENEINDLYLSEVAPATPAN